MTSATTFSDRPLWGFGVGRTADITFLMWPTAKCWLKEGSVGAGGPCAQPPFVKDRHADWPPHFICGFLSEIAVSRVAVAPLGFDPGSSPRKTFGERG